jgi:5,6,7,8-tetrahydromethanopterin hydro-lyase
MKGLPLKRDVFAAAREVSNPFYTPSSSQAAL